MYSILVNKGAMQIIKATSLGVLISAVSLPMSVWKLSTNLFDGQWLRCLEKAQKAGALLADVLRSKVQGDRPTTLIGTSLGAATIFHALLALAADSPPSNNLVYSATFVSMPIAPSAAQWAAVRSVVAGPINNVYSTSDWCLGLLTRASVHANMSIATPAGLGPVKLAEGVVSLDASEMIAGHMALVKPDVVGKVLAEAKAVQN